MSNSAKPLLLPFCETLSLLLSAFWVTVDIGLSASEVLSTFPSPTSILFIVIFEFNCLSLTFVLFGTALSAFVPWVDVANSVSSLPFKVLASIFVSAIASSISCWVTLPEPLILAWKTQSLFWYW